ncbi:related to Peroxisomal acyl-coenzyme A thioester hydrolase 1 [Zygosaccharomyces bailii ISA1307]|nr:related to Peroxisomal acyl-coenzyme A thioester hydrolase 1 [Zygosaccharomyces bailii ISA1307]
MSELEEILELRALSERRFISQQLSVPPAGARGTYGGELVAHELEEILELRALSERRFISQQLSVPPAGARGTYGGELVAQSLLAGLHCVGPAFVPCSLHSYFVTGGDPSVLLEYQVEDLRKGRSFVHQEVRAYQGSRLVCVTIILWGVEKRAAGAEPPHFKSLEQLPSDSGWPRGTRSLEQLPWELPELPPPRRLLPQEHQRVHQEQRLPMEYRFPEDMFEPKGPRDQLDYYVRIRERITPRSDKRYNYVAMAYLSDLYFLFAARTLRGKRLHDPALTTVSLDHTIHFHAFPHVNSWLYFQVRSPKSAGGRSLVLGEYFDPETREIVASTTQEGATIYRSKL